MKNSLDVVTIGGTMAMLIATQTGELADVEQSIKCVADAELNVATGPARLSLKIGWVSRVGNDSSGYFIVKSLEKEGIDAQGVTQDGRYVTGLQLKSKVENGTDPIVEYFRKGPATGHLSIEDHHETYFVSARHPYLSGIAAALSTSSYELLAYTVHTMKTQGKTISFDPNLCPVLWKSEAGTVEKLNQPAFRADWISPGLKEGMILTGQQTSEVIANSYLHHGVKAAIVKIGADGTWYKTTSGEQGCVAPAKVDNVADTVGAGDGLAVGVISALLEGRSLHQTVTRGNKTGALAVQAQGDSEGLSTREQLGGQTPGQLCILCTEAVYQHNQRVVYEQLN